MAAGPRLLFRVLGRDSRQQLLHALEVVAELGEYLRGRGVLRRIFQPGIVVGQAPDGRDRDQGAYPDALQRPEVGTEVDLAREQAVALPVACEERDLAPASAPSISGPDGAP